MSWGYFYMFLGLGCFSLLGIFAKVADTKKCRPSALYLLLCLWACALAFGSALIAGRTITAVPSVVRWLALPLGISGALAGVAFQTGIRYGKISTSWLVINLSAAIPTLGSIFIYHEPVGFKKLLALCLIVGSVLLLWKDKLEDEARR